MKKDEQQGDRLVGLTLFFKYTARLVPISSIFQRVSWCEKLNLSGSKSELNSLNSIRQEKHIQGAWLYARLCL